MQQLHGTEISLAATRDRPDTNCQGLWNPDLARQPTVRGIPVGLYVCLYIYSYIHIHYIYYT